MPRGGSGRGKVPPDGGSAATITGSTVASVTSRFETIPASSRNTVTSLLKGFFWLSRGMLAWQHTRRRQSQLPARAWRHQRFSGR